MYICTGCEKGHIQLIKADVSTLSTRNSLGEVIRIWIANPGFRTVVAFRLMSHFYCKKYYRRASWMRIQILKRYGADLVPGARIDQGFRIEHPVGIVIGKGVIVGKNFTVMHQVTLGQKEIHSKKLGGSPTIGDNVTIGTGACLFGDIRISKGTFIKSGSIVTQDR